MKTYHYTYITNLQFSEPVSGHSFSLRCMPESNAFQEVKERKLTVEPADSLTIGKDQWGNGVVYGRKQEPHSSFSYGSSGLVEMKPYAIPAEDDGSLYLVSTELTSFNPAMALLIDHALCTSASNHQPSGQATAIGKVLALSDTVHHYLSYTPGSTQMETTATQAFLLRQGVCQDYAHLLIALCRHLSIPARYVNGFMQGTGATHAWVEIQEGDQWLGIDPTNNQFITYGYIKLSHGRDAMDCPVNRGLFIGGATQTADIQVTVEEL